MRHLQRAIDNWHGCRCTRPHDPSPPGRGRGRSHAAGAVVTGAGSGIGEAFAFELARRESRVVCADIRADRANRTADTINARGGEALAVRCDVSSESEVRALAQAAEIWLARPPSLIVNNAGVGIGGAPIGETSLEDWRWALGVNLWGPVNGCHVFAPLLREAGHGGIINVASAASFAAAPNMAAYNVGKAAVLALSETLAAELSGSGVNVSVLCPTFVKTNIVEDGRIGSGSAQLAGQLMRWTGLSPSRIVRMTLDANDRGQLYAVPRLDARAIWHLKRLAPATYTRGAGLLNRFVPTDSKKETATWPSSSTTC
jgi:NAD(P)-dependent dehydrogenase (short-subunit alcohol dehydrogenase family)